jgi:hypothetical protein
MDIAPLDSEVGQALELLDGYRSAEAYAKNEDTIAKWVFKHADGTLRDFFKTKEGKESSSKAVKVVQAVTNTRVAKIHLRTNAEQARRFFSPSLRARQYAKNIVTGIDRNISRWNIFFPEDGKQQFLDAYQRTSLDDAFGHRVDAVWQAIQGGPLDEHLRRNPNAERLAELEAAFDEAKKAHAERIAAWVDGGKKGKEPKRPQTLIKEIRDLRLKVKKWRAPDDDAVRKTVARFVALHEYLEIFGAWGGSTTGRPTTKTYAYSPMTLVYPGCDSSTKDWSALLTCLKVHAERVVESGETHFVESVVDAYSMVTSQAAHDFSAAKQAHLDSVRKAKRQSQLTGKRVKPEVGRPRFQGDHDGVGFHVQAVAVGLGEMVEHVRESADGRGKWHVEARSADGTWAETDQYRPFLTIGGLKKAFEDFTPPQGRSIEDYTRVRISRAAYRRIRSMMACGGEISGVGVTYVPGQQLRSHKGRFFASVTVKDIPLLVPQRPAKNPVILGIDPGVRKFMTLSNGKMFRTLPRKIFVLEDEVAAIMRKMSAWDMNEARWKGKRYKRLNLALRNSHTQVVRIRRAYQERVLEKILSMRPDMIAIEDTMVKNMLQSAEGTHDLPAARGEASSKRLRNRNLIRQGIGQFIARLCQKCKRLGVPVILVPAAYTSQICCACSGVTNVGPSELFVCSHCGHKNDVDVNAAKIIRDRAAAMVVEYGYPNIGGKWDIKRFRAIHERKTATSG